MANDCWGPTPEQVERYNEEFGMPNLGKAVRGYISQGDYEEGMKSMPSIVIDTPVRTPEASIIVGELMSEFIELFLAKNAKYKSVQDGYDLGDKGIIPDLNRKLGILKSRLWDGEDTVGEDTDEVIQDMIGHLFLMWAKRRLR